MAEAKETNKRFIVKAAGIEEESNKYRNVRRHENEYYSSGETSGNVVLA